MEKKIIKAKQSNYEIQLHVSADEYGQAEKKALKHFQKDISVPGFRKGEVPLDMVKEKVSEQYITIGIYEELINNGIQEILAENKDSKFIGEPYDINQDQKDDKTIIMFKLDIYPEVTIKNNKWEKTKIQAIDSKPTQEDMDNAVMQLKKNYADYKDAETLTEETVSKVQLSFQDKAGIELHKTPAFIGEQEFTTDKFWTKTFVGKKKDETVEISYTEKSLPQAMHYNKDGDKPTKIIATIQDIKKVSYPEFTTEMIEKLFGKESEVKTEKQLMEFIEKSLAEQKYETLLVKAIEDYIQIVKKDSMEVIIPQTMTNEEYKVRVENLHQRFGGSKEKVKQFFDQMGEEKSKAFLEDIRKAASESLEKFFILKQICDSLALDINREKPGKLEIEEKLYTKVSK
jgi:trigger factor